MTSRSVTYTRQYSQVLSFFSLFFLFFFFFCSLLFCSFILCEKSAEETWKKVGDYGNLGPGLEVRLEGENNTVGCKRYISLGPITVIENLTAYSAKGPGYSMTYEFCVPNFGAETYTSTWIVSPTSKNTR